MRIEALAMLVPVLSARALAAETGASKVWTAEEYNALLAREQAQNTAILREICDHALGTAAELEQLRQDALLALRDSRVRIADLPDWQRDGSVRDAALASNTWAINALEEEVVELHALATREEIRGADFERYVQLVSALRQGAEVADRRFHGMLASFEGRTSAGNLVVADAVAPEVIESFTRRYMAGMRADQDALLDNVLPTLDVALWLGPENEQNRAQDLDDLLRVRERIVERGPWRGDPTLMEAQLKSADALIGVLEGPGVVMADVMFDFHRFFWERPRFRRAVAQFDRGLSLAEDVQAEAWLSFERRWLPEAAPTIEDNAAASR